VTIEVGQSIPEFSRMGSLHAWNRYAAVNYEFVDIHMDDEAGRAAGYPGAFAMGNISWAWIHCMLREWLADLDGHIVSVACQFRAPSLRGKVVTAKGVVTAVHPHGDQILVELDVWTESDGAQLAPGSATVALPA
jgi:acyl dehydratase